MQSHSLITWNTILRICVNVKIICYRSRPMARNPGCKPRNPGKAWARLRSGMTAQRGRFLDYLCNKAPTGGDEVGLSLSPQKKAALRLPLVFALPEVLALEAHTSHAAHTTHSVHARGTCRIFLLRKVCNHSLGCDQ